MRLSFVCLTMETHVRTALRCIASMASSKPLVWYKSGSAVKVYYLPGCWTCVCRNKFLCMMYHFFVLQGVLCKLLYMFKVGLQVLNSFILTEIGGLFSDLDFKRAWTCWYTLSHYSFGRLVVHVMNADHPVRGFLWFSTTKGKCRDRP